MLDTKSSAVLGSVRKVMKTSNLPLSQADISCTEKDPIKNWIYRIFKRINFWAGVKCINWCMHLAQFGKTAENNKCANYLIVCGDLFCRRKTQNERIQNIPQKSSNNFQQLHKKKLEPTKKGLVRVQNLRENFKRIGKVNKFQSVLQWKKIKFIFAELTTRPTKLFFDYYRGD